MPNFVKSQKIIAKRFKDTLDGRWTESIAQRVDYIVNKEFKINSSAKEITKN